MKKAERIEEIRKLAEEYARTGDYDDWLSIEHRLTSERFSLAEEALGDRFIREQLDETCKVATSRDEVERRNRFKSWLEIAIIDARSAAEEKTPAVTLFVQDRILHVNGPSCSFKIQRKFGSDDLEFAKSWVEKDGKRFQHETYNQIPDSNLKGITAERTLELVMEFAVRAAAA